MERIDEPFKSRINFFPCKCLSCCNGIFRNFSMKWCIHQFLWIFTRFLSVVVFYFAGNHHFWFLPSNFPQKPKVYLFRSAIWILWDHCTNLNWSQNGKYEVHYENFPMIFFIYIFHNRCEILEINNLHWWRFLFFNNLFKEIICGALRDLVPFVPFEKRKKHLWRCITFTKVAGFSHFVKINTPPWVFFKLFKTYKWYLIAQNVSYFW